MIVIKSRKVELTSPFQLGRSGYILEWKIISPANLTAKLFINGINCPSFGDDSCYDFSKIRSILRGENGSELLEKYSDEDGGLEQLVRLEDIFFEAQIEQFNKVLSNKQLFSCICAKGIEVAHLVVDDGIEKLEIEESYYFCEE